MAGALVLLNPHAAGGRAAALAGPIAAWLAAHASSTGLIQPDRVADAHAAIAATAPGQRLVIVGGDGTLHQLLPALLARPAGAVGIVPFGSGNDGARAFGLARLGWGAALAHALQAEPEPFDIGEIEFDGRKVPFASSLTAGFDSAVGLRAIAGPRRLRGLPRYLLATLRELAALRNWPLRIEADGVPVHDGDALFASALNTPTYGSGMPAVPAARIDDGALDLLIAGRFGRLATALMLPRLLAARHLSHPQVKTLRFATLTATAPAPVPLAGDGEPLGEAMRWTVRVRPAALQVVARRRTDS